MESIKGKGYFKSKMVS